MFKVYTLSAVVLSICPPIEKLTQQGDKPIVEYSRKAEKMQPYTGGLMNEK